jgi:hypothetical protein
MTRTDTVEMLLRIGVAFAFIYPAVAAFFDPFSWIGFFPTFMRDLAPSETLLLHAFGITEILIAMWILVGKRIFIPSVLASLYLTGIILFNLALFDIIFRDVSILFMALALVILHHTKHSAKSTFG